MFKELEKEYLDNRDKLSKALESDEESDLKEKCIYPLILKVHCLLIDTEKDLMMIGQNEHIKDDIDDIETQLKTLHLELYYLLKKAVNVCSPEHMKSDPIKSEHDPIKSEQDIIEVKKSSNFILSLYNKSRMTKLEENLKHRVDSLSKINNRALKKAKLKALQEKLEKLKDHNESMSLRLKEANDKIKKISKPSVDRSLLKSEINNLLSARRKMVLLSFRAMRAHINSRSRAEILFKEIVNDNLYTPRIDFINLVLILLKALKLYGKVDKSENRDYDYVTIDFNKKMVVAQAKTEVDAVLEEISRKSKISSKCVRFADSIEKLLLVVERTNFICPSYPVSEEYIDYDNLRETRKAPASFNEMCSVNFAH